MTGRGGPELARKETSTAVSASVDPTASPRESVMTDFAYIMSPSYSGSTLLTFLLATHPKIATIGELKATSMGNIDEYTCSCGSRIRECGFWNDVIDMTRELDNRLDLANFGTHFRFGSRPIADRLIRARLRGGLHEFVREAVLRIIPGCRRAFLEIVEKNGVIADAAKRIQGGDVFLDGSKDAIRLKYLVASNRWRIKTVHLVRDGRGMANSLIRHQGGAMEEAALEWRKTTEECERMAARLPNGSCVRVLYEDLCRDPDGVLRSILGFLGLDADPANRDFLSAEHHILGNSMRLTSSSEIALDEKWKSALTPEDLATFDQVAGDLNRKYGYT